ncbi:MULTISPECIES: hypothetical protein [Cyanophyceae]|uniref:Uncharacterized protein n=1 Tax=Leptolyngbya subtilissima DQ-A4 TaxID=2933933 RepID=A0ABV0K833_9CYAN|nr:hypothetical protein [Nodosilinea sp. FACHB-141]
MKRFSHFCRSYRAYCDNGASKGRICGSQLISCDRAEVTKSVLIIAQVSLMLLAIASTSVIGVTCP